MHNLFLNEPLARWLDQQTIDRRLLDFRPAPRHAVVDTLAPEPDLVIVVRAVGVAGLAAGRDTLRSVPSAYFIDLPIAGRHLHQARGRLGSIAGDIRGCAIAAHR